jgi:RNA polymerase sigma-70 factor (ECF subfamily)
MPANPRAWLVSTGRFKAIDALRRRSRLDTALDDLEERLDVAPNGSASAYAIALSEASRGLRESETVADDHLRLIFTCCHPLLPQEARVALTLREVCGLTTEEIAHAFLTSTATTAQRIVRAKARLREAGVPFEVPSEDELPERLEAVLEVIYLVFNEGYLASAGADLTRPDLSGEAIRLARVLLDLLPEPEVAGLLALLLLQDARRPARTSPAGNLIPLEEQDRSLWNQEQIDVGTKLVDQLLGVERYDKYTLQAAIAAVHGRAASAAETDWGEIVRLYDRLVERMPSPVVELNRAVAVAMANGPDAGLPLIDALLDEGGLGQYHLAHAARADLCRRLGRTGDARASYERALELTQQETERHYLERRIAELGTATNQ